MNKQVVEKVKALINPYLEENGVYLFDIEYVKEGNEDILRIYIDNETQTMDLITCCNISEGISSLLDSDDPIDVPYSLEVSSPGAERPLRNADEIKKNVGNYIYFETNEEAYLGTLVSFEDNILDVEYLVKNIKKHIKVDYSKIIKIRLAIKF